MLQSSRYSRAGSELPATLRRSQGSGVFRECPHLS